MINYQAARRKIASGQLAPIYLLFGEEDYFIDDLIDRLVKVHLGDSAGYGLERVDGSAETLEESLARLQGGLLFSDKRLLILEKPSYLAPSQSKSSKKGLRKPAGIEGSEDETSGREEESTAAEPAKDKNGIKQLERFLDQAASGQQLNSILVLRASSVDARKRLYKLLDRRGEAVKCERLKGEALKSWLVDRAKQAGKRIDGDALEMLLMTGRQELYFFAKEIDKFVTYLREDESVISAPVVERLLSGGAPGNVFNLVDSLAEGNLTAALRHLRLLQASREEPLFIFFMIVRQFRLLLEACSILDQGLPQSRLAVEMKVQPFIARKLIQQCTVCDRTVLEDIMLLLQDTDRRIKTGRLDQGQALTVTLGRINALLHNTDRPDCNI